MSRAAIARTRRLRALATAMRYLLRANGHERGVGRDKFLKLASPLPGLHRCGGAEVRVGDRAPDRCQRFGGQLGGKPRGEVVDRREQRDDRERERRSRPGAVGKDPAQRQRADVVSGGQGDQEDDDGGLSQTGAEPE